MAFQRWFGDSKVADESGKPLVVYHGTPSIWDFSKFEVPAYFTDDPAFASIFAAGQGDYRGAVYPGYLSIQNPYEIDGDRDGRRFEWDADDVARMEGEGYDGVIVRTADASNIYTIFRPEQVKSAIANRDTYDPGSPNILME